MISAPLELTVEYTIALQAYLQGSGEDALSRAYDLGREALASGLGVLDIATIHRDAVRVAVRRGGIERAFSRAAEFFSEALGPFEMTFRGYAEANERLQLLNATLVTHNVELRAAKAEADAANQELESFSYSVAHDLRAPLRSVSAFSHILQQELTAGSSGQTTVLLSHVVTNAKRMEALIEDLLQFSRVSRQPIERRPVDVAALVKKILGEIQPQQGLRRIDVRIGELPEALADRSLLEQVFLNLLTNAFKFTRKRDLAVVEIGGRQDADGVLYFVRDNGAGFDMRYADRLFKAFQRLHHVSQFEGTGVGLSIVQRIVQRHGGRVWVDAEEDQGATFQFTLPRSSVPGGATPR
jgi:light-regulated signal transduction histidine kinase (bacteriophytochrome)